MVKRTKTTRPAGRRPASRPAARPAAEPAAAAPIPTRSSASLSEAEVQRAAEIEAQLLAQEKAAEQMRRRGRAGRELHGPDVNAPLAVRAAKEYAYVARDVRHIIFTASIMAAILAVLAVLVNVLGVVTF